MIAYVQEFEELSSQITGIDDEMLEAIFKGELKSELRNSKDEGTSRSLSHDRDNIGNGGRVVV